MHRRVWTYQLLVPREHPQEQPEQNLPLIQGRQYTSIVYSIPDSISLPHFLILSAAGFYLSVVGLEAGPQSESIPFKHEFTVYLSL